MAQHQLSGVVTNGESFKPMAGVSIYIHTLKLGSVTDKNGLYVLPQLRTGTYFIEVSYLGHQTITKSLSILRDTIVNFTMDESTTELNEVIVTGVSRHTELKMSPIIIKPVDINGLFENGSTNLIDGLKTVPGINQITTGAGISKPIIRGMGYNRVVTLFNGIRQEGQQWGDEHGVEVDDHSIGRIEIVKGPGSLMYGSDGIAGVINFISTKAPSSNATKTQLLGTYQSNNNLIGHSVMYAGNKKGFQWVGRFSHKLVGNYQNAYDGKIHNSGFREYNGSLHAGINRTWGFSHVNISSFNTTLNMVEGDRDSAGNFVFERVVGANTETVSATKTDLSGYNIGFPHQKVNHFRVLSNNLFFTKMGSLNVDLGYQNNRRREYGDILLPDDAELYFNLNTLNYNLRLNLVEKKGWESSFGVSGMQQSNANKGEEFLIPAYTLLDIGGFAFTQKTFRKKLTLAGGLRFDNRSLRSDALLLDSNENPTNTLDSFSYQKFDALNNSFQNISGSMGLSYLLTKKSTLKLNFSRGYRAPNIAELTSNGKHEGSLRYEFGNRFLKPEISHQIDVAFFYNSEHFTVELTPFVNFISNYIYTSKLFNSTGFDSIPDPSDPSAAFKFNQGDARLVGGEIFVDLHPHPYDWLHIENSFSIVQATQRHVPDSLRFLPMIPAPKYRVELKAQFKKVGSHFFNCYAKIGLEHYFAQNQYFLAYGTETNTPAYTLLNAGLGTTINTKGVHDAFKIYLFGENLSNLAYQSHLSRLKYAPVNPASGRNGVYNMGRNFGIKLILTI